MALFRRPSRPIGDSSSVQIPRSEHRLASADLTDGWVAATRAGIVFRLGDTVVRRAWTDVDHASLDGESSVLTISWVTGEVTALPLVPKKRLAFPQVFRERVQASIVYTVPVRLPGGGTARVALRRRATGELLSQVIGDGRVDLSDPVVARLVGAAEAEIWRAAGVVFEGW